MADSSTAETEYRRFRFAQKISCLPFWDSAGNLTAAACPPEVLDETALGIFPFSERAVRKIRRGEPGTVTIEDVLAYEIPAESGARHEERVTAYLMSAAEEAGISPLAYAELVKMTPGVSSSGTRAEDIAHRLCAVAFTRDSIIALSNAGITVPFGIVHSYPRQHYVTSDSWQDTAQASVPPNLPSAKGIPMCVLWVPLMVITLTFSDLLETEFFIL